MVILHKFVIGISNEDFNIPDYDGASTSEARDDAEKEQQDTDDGGDGVSSEGEKLPTTGSNDVSRLLLIFTSTFIDKLWLQDDTSEADMLEQPQMTRTTRSSGAMRGSPSSPSRGRILRGHTRGGNRIQPIVWNQDMQIMQGGE